MRSSEGAISTPQQAAIGASDAAISAFWWPAKSSTVENMTAPSTARANRLISVCETIVPSTTGNWSRARPSRRATIIARAGSPRRAGSVADIRTPMNVPCIASRRRTLARGSAARRIEYQASARSTIEQHISPRPASTQTGLV